MRAENTLCLVVDIQERLLPTLANAEEMVERSSVLIQGLQALVVPLLVTEQYPRGLGKTVPAIMRLLNDDTPVLEKIKFSALLPEVVDCLQEKRIQNVILLGAETHICMLQTALELRAAGFDVWVPFEATTSRQPANKENGLQQMRAAGVTISNVESILFQLLGDAKHPAFKIISKLIV